MVFGKKTIHHTVYVLILCVLSIFAVFRIAGCKPKAGVPEPAGDRPSGKPMMPAVILPDKTNHATLDFVCRELDTFLREAGLTVYRASDTNDAQGEKLNLEFIKDADMAPYSFGVRLSGGRLELRGPDETCIAHAAYTLLEHLGYRFELTGPVVPGTVSAQALEEVDITIRPAVNVRGPRLYMNFPMDLSSYSAEQAHEYIRNLARMRFNLFAFHTYPGQWYEVKLPNGTTQYAGSFFYGQRHDIPDNELLQRVLTNEKTYCIPEIEPSFDDVPARSRMAVAWMKSVLDEAKRVGMTVHVSFEPRNRTTDTALTLDTCEQIVAQYPQIDVLELTTEEHGTWYPPDTPEEARKALATHFNDEWISRFEAAGLLESSQPGLAHVLDQLGHTIRAAKEISQRWKDSDKPKINVGIYCSIPPYLPLFTEIYRKEIPASIGVSILPGHGAYRFYKHTRLTGMNAEDIARTLFIGWYELDGSMYTLQNSISGVYHLINDLTQTTGGESIQSICFIHWRLTESVPTARYSSLACLQGPIRPDDFYAEYAGQIGIRPVNSFAAAMKYIDKVNEEWVDDLSISFCYLPCWGPKVDFLAGRGPDRQQKARAAFEAALEQLRTCARETTDARGMELLNFLDNRLRLSIIYFRAFEKAYEVVPIIGSKAPEELTADERDRVADIFNQSLLIMDQYMALHAEQMPDRKAEGNLISFYHTSPEYIKRKRAEYCGIAHDTAAVTEAIIDAPPMPITQEH